jgi:hypothetical protein
MSKGGRGMTLAIKLTDEQARALAEAAEQLQVSEADLAAAAAAVRGLVSAPAADFADAARRVLRKNEELYRRLA